MNEDALLLLLPFLGLFWSTLLTALPIGFIRPSPLYIRRNVRLARFRGKDFDRSDGQKFFSIWTWELKRELRFLYTRL